MVNKTITQGIIILVLFFGIWFGLSRLDFMRYFHVSEARNNTEKKLGDLIWGQISETETIIRNDSVIKAVDKLIVPICEKNGIQRDSLKIHIIKNEEVNAFALPDNHLVIYTGLINKCDKQEAFQGVIGHEIAHLENNHVMKKLSKEIGLSVLLAATTGREAGTILSEIFHLLSSSAYDRSLEEEADMQSVHYLIKANIDPVPLADFMYQLSMEHKLPDNFYWISTHPESEARAKKILDHIKGKKIKKQQILKDAEWLDFKKMTGTL